MPIPVDQAVAAAAASAADKARAARDVPRYWWSSMLSGAYVGIAVVLLVSVTAPLFEAGSPATKLVQGAVFGLALTLVAFAGAELFTGNTMFLAQGLRAGTVGAGDVAIVSALSLVGNVAGGAALAVVAHAGGTLSTEPNRTLVASLVDAKNLAAGPQLFWRAVLCNLLVCLALWMALRVDGDGTRAAVLWWCPFAFIGSGFEHSIANVTTFSLAALQGSGDVADLVRNLAWTVPGNALGGAVLVGLGYAWLGGARPPEGDPGTRPG